MCMFLNVSLKIQLEFSAVFKILPLESNNFCHPFPHNCLAQECFQLVFICSSRTHFKHTIQKHVFFVYLYYYNEYYTIFP